MTDIIKTVRYIAYAALFVVFIIGFTFSLLSGSSDTGIINNIPNALPWLLLLVLVYIITKWELFGGIMIALLGISTMIFFDVQRFPIVLFLISLPLVFLGTFFVVCWYIAGSKH